MFQLFFIISPIFLEIKYFFLYTMIKNSLCAFPPLYAEVSAMITDQSIEYIYTVYREGSFSKAAQKLYVSQPALSAMIRKTEAELHNIPLFDRSSKPIRLTQAGEYFISAVSQIMEIQNDITEYCREHELALIGPNLVGMGSPYEHFNCGFIPYLPVPGPIAMISQSGANLLAALGTSQEEQLGMSFFVGLGNKADVDFSEFVEYAETDPHTNCLAIYIEGLDSPEAFVKSFVKQFVETFSAAACCAM